MTRIMPDDVTAKSECSFAGPGGRLHSIAHFPTNPKSWMVVVDDCACAQAIETRTGMKEKRTLRMAAPIATLCGNADHLNLRLCLQRLQRLRIVAAGGGTGRQDWM